MSELSNKTKIELDILFSCVARAYYMIDEFEAIRLQWLEDIKKALKESEDRIKEKI